MTRCLISLVVVLVAAAGTVTARPIDSRVADLENVVEKLVTQLQAQADELAELRQEVATLRLSRASRGADEESVDMPNLRVSSTQDTDRAGDLPWSEWDAASRVQRSGANIPCGCNSFNASTVSIGDGSTVTELLVGSATTGTINGVNIVQLANTAVTNVGDQVIAGALTVNSLKIGQWTLQDSPSGLTFSQGATTVTISPEGALSVNEVLATTITASGAVDANMLSLGLWSLQQGSAGLDVNFNGTAGPTVTVANAYPGFIMEDIYISVRWHSLLISSGSEWSIATDGARLLATGLMSPADDDDKQRVNKLWVPEGNVKFGEVYVSKTINVVGQVLANSVVTQYQVTAGTVMYTPKLEVNDKNCC